jgi:hypothetical protein
MEPSGRGVRVASSARPTGRAPPDRPLGRVPRAYLALRHPWRCDVHDRVLALGELEQIVARRRGDLGQVSAMRQCGLYRISQNAGFGNAEHHVARLPSRKIESPLSDLRAVEGGEDDAPRAAAVLPFSFVALVKRTRAGLEWMTMVRSREVRRPPEPRWMGRPRQHRRGTNFWSGNHSYRRVKGSERGSALT